MKHTLLNFVTFKTKKNKQTNKKVKLKRNTKVTIENMIQWNLE